MSSRMVRPSSGVSFAVSALTVIAGVIGVLMKPVVGCDSIVNFTPVTSTFTAPMGLRPRSRPPVPPRTIADAAYDGRGASQLATLGANASIVDCSRRSTLATVGQKTSCWNSKITALCCSFGVAPVVWQTPPRIAFGNVATAGKVFSSYAVVAAGGSFVNVLNPIGKPYMMNWRPTLPTHVLVPTVSAPYVGVPRDVIGLAGSFGPPRTANSPFAPSAAANDTFPTGRPPQAKTPLRKASPIDSALAYIASVPRLASTCAAMRKAVDFTAASAAAPLPLYWVESSWISS